MRLASSWMVMVSGMVTSRTSFSFGSSAVCAFSRWTRRRKAATERSRSSSALSAVTTVCRPRRAGTAACARGLVLVGLERRPRAGPCRRNAVLAETFLGLLLGLDLGLEVVFAALLFVGFARLGGLAFGALGGLAQSADKRLLFRNLALLGFAQASVVERVHARLLLFLSEAAQHHTARRLAGGGGSGRGGRRGRRRRGGLGGGGALGSRPGRRGRVGLRSRRHAAFHLLDDDRLGAAVAETLAHDALLDPAPFEGQGLARAHAELLFASLFRRFSHSNLNSRVSRRGSSCSCVARLGRVAGMTPAATRRTRLRAGPKIVKARGARQKPLAFGTGEQGCMYHI